MLLNAAVPFSVFSGNASDFLSNSITSFLRAYFSSNANDIICTSSRQKNVVIISFPSDMASVQSVTNALNSNHDMSGKLISVSNIGSAKTSIKWKINS